MPEYHFKCLCFLNLMVSFISSAFCRMLPSAIHRASNTLLRKKIMEQQDFASNLPVNEQICM